MSDLDQANPFEADPLFIRASIGIEASQFFATRIGRHVIESAEREIDQGYRELAEVDPDDSKAIRDIQMRIRVARAAPQWLAKAITDGEIAESQIREQESSQSEDY